MKRSKFYLIITLLIGIIQSGSFSLAGKGAVLHGCVKISSAQTTEIVTIKSKMIRCMNEKNTSVNMVIPNIVNYESPYDDKQSQARPGYFCKKVGYMESDKNIFNGCIMKSNELDVEFEFEKSPDKNIVAITHWDKNWSDGICVESGNKNQFALCSSGSGCDNRCFLDAEEVFLIYNPEGNPKEQLENEQTDL